MRGVDWAEERVKAGGWCEEWDGGRRTMATAPSVGQNNEKTMTREQRTMTWIGRTKTENKEKSKS